MPTLIELLLAYGICFGAMNKVDFLHRKSAFTDRLLKCSYCTGFHAGWMAWGLARMVHGWGGWQTLPEALLWAFSSAVFCYSVDTVLQLAESWVRKSD